LGSCLEASAKSVIRSNLRGAGSAPEFEQHSSSNAEPPTRERLTTDEVELLMTIFVMVDAR
jgi:hypothetical protein